MGHRKLVRRFAKMQVARGSLERTNGVEWRQLALADRHLSELFSLRTCRLRFALSSVESLAPQKKLPQRKAKQIRRFAVDAHVTSAMNGS